MSFGNWIRKKGLYTKFVQFHLFISRGLRHQAEMSWEKWNQLRKLKTQSYQWEPNPKKIDNGKKWSYGWMICQEFWHACPKSSLQVLLVIFSHFSVFCLMAEFFVILLVQFRFACDNSPFTDAKLDQFHQVCARKIVLWKCLIVFPLNLFKNNERSLHPVVS